LDRSAVDRAFHAKLAASRVLYRGHALAGKELAGFSRATDSRKNQRHAERGR